MGEYLKNKGEYVAWFVGFTGFINGSRDVQGTKLAEIADAFKEALCHELVYTSS